MQPQLSICRKRENLYLKLQGNLTEASSEEILRAVKRLVLTSLQFASPEAQVFSPFKPTPEAVRPWLGQLSKARRWRQ